jgi:hypothetical protein
MPVRYLDDGDTEGNIFGQSATAKISFYGATPVVRPSGAAQAAITDGSTGTANSATGVAALTATYNSTLLINAIATIVAQTNAIRSALVTVGIMKGSA